MVLLPRLSSGSMYGGDTTEGDEITGDSVKRLKRLVMTVIAASTILTVTTTHLQRITVKSKEEDMKHMTLSTTQKTT
eukprot:6140579-Amphidinium_carterae.1